MGVEEETSDLFIVAEKESEDLLLPSINQAHDPDISTRGDDELVQHPVIIYIYDLGLVLLEIGWSFFNLAYYLLPDATHHFVRPGSSVINH